MSAATELADLFSAAETAAMEEALALAARGPRGANPLVGAIVLDAEGRTLATGHHRGAGTAHAEADALANLRAAGGLADPAGATMVVTLEPCNHQGRTGPCAQAILDAGIGNVVYAVADPHLPAAGGAERLRAAGVQVRTGLLGSAAEELNGRWFAAARAGRPFVTLKLAQSMDGRIAAADGTSQWITSAESRADGHALRSRVDAILVGTETVLVDNPRLNARAADGGPAARQPLRVVLGLRDTPAGAAVRTGNHGGTHDGGAVQEGAGGGFLALRTRSPRQALRLLAGHGVGHLMVEGGSRVAAAFLADDLVDELIIYLAPTLIGAGLPALADLGIGTLSEAKRWRWDAAAGGPQLLGLDLKLTLTPAPAAATTTEEGH
ncbi:bifunctional diaminohydroxyphosphoribosylaminopyrimidine deaminase/5-amino-6-(5-phosphoribosylamino)uracil reductase RibD [Arthrobacter sp. 35W]|uniref:bifunctional diaminohydroxyphosphoribosylaminopyrimidine deaminase/5-amino-6-(5-phosphoribosylamino)uracil reductase RibD n=1 Tax=Arthrobacter sp. 35W TaxID=1132441 RepID=UPI000420BBC7|nr:bifunctional diaminohydroxyphosphoribosylaminopyrimidine deaminase/5-amino-6-(5-phosphoribosylamino)uracil reductase RibD [Arthrobacter sp. 35W]